ncbi:hypothetical protein L596_019481 [Steinernema carpocapsae]|uniref:Uncharacterized protein n=1 Tax=Steinernema carpocapsae TaxID=34508 RepID=A0A4U5MRH6_STECR|nr:hypothetical protein L596_019481 [Steinernema carpocapsae]
MTTQFESTSARLAFPCWDEPVYKAQFTITLDVESKYEAISNTPEYRVEATGKRKKVTFETTPLMSTYLIAMAVGDLEYVEGQSKNGPLVRVYTTPGKSILAKKALEYHLKAFEYYAELFNYTYPMSKCDALALPDFASGAMENWGLITYREHLLVYNESTVAREELIYAAAVVGHEVGHFWFGDLVTMVSVIFVMYLIYLFQKWWNDLWLKEGFATFLMYQFVEDNYPEMRGWEEFFATALPLARDIDELEYSHPIQMSLDDPNKLALYYDSVTYRKSCHIIRMLYLYLGREKFLDGLRKYIKTHQYSNAVTDDLWQAFSDATGKVSLIETTTSNSKLLIAGH